ncbi:S8 family serine peptidase [Arthrospira platensis]|uniref:S8 family serine peptidase n=1 Tax=Limnospira platensis TaxID=118562 RepID=UPI001689C0B6|nr:S8 family serine peptidase [Arthrospira platensis]MBD2669074.1 S8 family serine peptidase [Arthrospira platensis FACHB-439]MBD2709464.1 S8 family serine peptidase [Arthrospira platensis FACHB-835]MDT9294862.1 S8 family serine peptidase [Arthrospira platensis PCC 7345]QQW28446.1 S8 family serine peptidase [Arthrospira sp. PCC 9108]MBD2572568.1 S8 family serine peptidase [Arthrospira platensis FACHB-971]
MDGQVRQELPDLVYAEAVVRSASGESLLSTPTLVTSENVTQFDADPRLIEYTAERLQSTGFNVLSIGRASISISGSPELYEQSFQTTLAHVEYQVIKEFYQPSTAHFIDSVDDKPSGEIDISQSSWNTELVGVAINEPVSYLGSNVPSAFPPPAVSQYLSVPDCLAKALNANQTHDGGIDGRGVKVVMVDSGWYNHPFFTHHNYQGQVILAPGSTDKDIDANGHGTGESANLFAVAPGVDFIMVKADVAIAGKSRNVNSIAAFRTAIAQRPDIISCSWGSNQRSSELSPYNKVLATLVADAVRRGITVIFSAGNGHWSFPAQHPDAIAAGGVYKHLNGPTKGELEASNYSSAFYSPVYRGRQVPDVCGLVGQRPHAAYIMLPVPPGSWTDIACAEFEDGTEANDGWAAFSGTSAAAPQVAGVCALLKQLDPGLSPALAKRILEKSAIDVVKGFSNYHFSRPTAGPGRDLATGYGLVDAWNAIATLRQVNNQVASHSQIIDYSQADDTFNPALSAALNCDCDSPSAASYVPDKASDHGLSNTWHSHSIEPETYQSTLPTISTPRSQATMSNNYPKLNNKFDEILNDFDNILKGKIAAGEIEAVELNISRQNFSDRSPRTEGILALVACLQELEKSWDDPETVKESLVNDIVKSAKTTLEKAGFNLRNQEIIEQIKSSYINNLASVEPQPILKKHVSAAKSLLRIQKYQKLATGILIKAIQEADEKVAALAAEALGEFHTTQSSEDIEIESSDFLEKMPDGIYQLRDGRKIEIRNTKFSGSSQRYAKYIHN